MSRIYQGKCQGTAAFFNICSEIYVTNGDRVQLTSELGNADGLSCKNGDVVTDSIKQVNNLKRFHSLPALLPLRFFYMDRGLAAQFVMKLFNLFQVLS
ncbi:hypothetical protein Sjap_018479 [Stephania japonica]|uniref:Uncharacterized protein n=1 Tax=Stephania japonica TaxID=461633 RepID=A0AAP0I819_9MAGN